MEAANVPRQGVGRPSYVDWPDEVEQPKGTARNSASGHSLDPVVAVGGDQPQA